MASLELEYSSSGSVTGEKCCIWQENLILNPLVSLTSFLPTTQISSNFTSKSLLHVKLLLKFQNRIWQCFRTTELLSRGYYRCSTAKGCSAKKQVERCKSDASVLVVTYTSSHNHPEGIRGVPRIPKQTRQQQRSLESREDPQEQEEAQSEEDQEAQPTMEAEEFHYSKDLHEGELFTMSQLDTTVNNGSLGLVFLEQESVHVLPTESGSNNSSSELIPPMKPTEAEVEEDEYYDFFDELEELHPTISLLSYGFQEHHQLVGWRDSSCPVRCLPFLLILVKMVGFCFASRNV